MNRNHRISIWLLAGLLVLLVGGAIAILQTAGSGPSTAPAGNLSGADVGGPFTLVDGNGKTVTEAQFAGQYRLIYFGYTFCPDVCPTDVQKLALGLKAFEKSDPALAAKVTPIFVSIDPDRDTPDAVRQFAGAFHPRLVGLTGSRAQIDAIIKTFRIYAAKRGNGENYLMDHSAMIYLFDPAGKPISFLQQPSPAEVEADLTRFVR